MTVILETRSLNKEFGAVIAAKDLDVRISKGEIVGVIGSNGAGKTTFINMVILSRPVVKYSLTASLFLAVRHVPSPVLAWHVHFRLHNYFLK